MTDMRSVLETERVVEREFAAIDCPDPQGWSVALTMFHFVRWRERMHSALTAIRDGRPYTPPPDNIDSFNEAEVATASQVPFADSTSLADSLLASVIDVYDAVGDRPFTWYRWTTTTEALLGSTYVHPHTHMVEFFKENGDLAAAVRLMERTVAALRPADVPARILGVEIYNLACLRVAEGRNDDALRLIEESVAMRPGLKDVATSDPDLTALYDDERFRAI